MPKSEELAQLVFFVRDEKVMFDADLAKLYGVTTKALNQAISRNINRFPEDFAFRLAQREFEQMRSQIVTAYPKPNGLRSQIVTSKKGRGGRRYLPYVFTEQEGGHAFKRPAQPACGRGKYRHYAHICAAPSSHGYEPRSCSQNRRTGKEVR